MYYLRSTETITEIGERILPEISERISFAPSFTDNELRFQFVRGHGEYTNNDIVKPWRKDVVKRDRK